MAYTVIILAGGKSRRFGYDKTLLRINGAGLIELIAEKCRPVFSQIIIAGGDRTDFGLPGVCCAPDIYSGTGPLGGLHAGLAAAANEVCFVTACDMPNFYVPAAKRLLASAQGYDAVLFKSGGLIQPLFAVYNKSVLPYAERLLAQGANSLLRLLETIRVRYIELPAEQGTAAHGIFFNINRREDYEMFQNSAPPVLSVVGCSGAGKTTYLEKLIPALKRRGLKPGVIKHDAHSFDIDIPGKDSWRLTRAGADITVIASPERIAVLEQWHAEEDLLHVALRLKGKVDLVLTEGYKRGTALKIEIRRAAAGGDAVCSDAELFAVVTDCADVSAAVPVLPLDDAEPMADLIMEGWYHDFA